jgi:hypothetical protein
MNVNMGEPDKSAGPGDRGVALGIMGRADPAAPNAAERRPCSVYSAAILASAGRIRRMRRDEAFGASARPHSR